MSGVLALDACLKHTPFLDTFLDTELDFGELCILAWGMLLQQDREMTLCTGPVKKKCSSLEDAFGLP